MMTPAPKPVRLQLSRRKGFNLQTEAGMGEAISARQFAVIVGRIETIGGEWRVWMGAEGCFLAYAGEQYRITADMAAVMFETMPRPGDNPPNPSPAEDGSPG